MLRFAQILFEFKIFKLKTLKTSVLILLFTLYIYLN